jgi:hypothetical protein
MEKWIFPFAIISMVCVFCRAGSQEPLVIAENGKADSVIVLSANAAIQEKHAAQELADFLGKAADCSFRVVEKPQPSFGSIVVGLSSAVEVDPDFTIDSNDQEAIVIKKCGDKLFLAGNGSRGTLYAVYTFLEDYIGCRWWTKEDSYIPSKSEIKISRLDYKYSPAIKFRNSFWIQCFDADWGVRNKCNNASRFNLDSKRGGGYVYAGFVHTFYHLIPPEEYFERHPEWFSLVDGKRTTDKAQLCLTNMELADQIVEKLRGMLKKKSNRTVIASVSQNDCYGHCQCDKCKQIDELEGSPAGTLLRFVNYIAEKLEKDYPNVQIDTLAYQYTQPAPKITKPRHNVAIRLCPIEADFSVPFSHERNKTFYKDLHDWSKICSNLRIWNYSTNFFHYALAFPNFHILDENMRIFVDNNVNGVMEQGNHKTAGSWMAEMKGWVTAKLLWDASLEVEDLCRIFAQGYYGDAAEDVLRYLDRLETAVVEHPFFDEEPKAGMNLRTPPAADFLSYEILRDCWNDLKKAQQKASNDPVILSRIQMMQSNALYPVIIRWQELNSYAKENKLHWPYDWHSSDDAYKWWKKITSEAGVTYMNEWNKIENMDYLLSGEYTVWDFLAKSPVDD